MISEKTTTFVSLICDNEKHCSQMLHVKTPEPAVTKA